MIGALGKLDVIWLLADVFNGLMAIPNLIALVALSPVVFRLTQAHFKKLMGYFPVIGRKKP